MPSFGPTRSYLVRLTEELIREHGLSGPFLEIGCGDGEISLRLARNGWQGVALDLSEEAAQSVRERLEYAGLAGRVEPLRLDFLEMPGDRRFRTILCYDVLEHVAQDREFMHKMRSSLEDGGFLLLSVPVKMKEWRWDDDSYGHLRRYEFDELDRLVDSPAMGFRKLAQWDITFPALWFLRRVFLAIKPPPPGLLDTPVEMRTEHSAFANSGANKGLLVRIGEAMPIWGLAFWLQDRFRKRRLGCNTLVLAEAIIPPVEPAA